jgi:hypothetical protein
MKKCSISLCILLVFSVSAVFGGEIKPSDVAGKPNVFCTVVNEPNPVLLGHYGCVYKMVNEKTHEHTMEPVEYWLVKLEGQYGLYFYRVKDGKGTKFKGWRKWYLRGDKITSGGDPLIFSKDGDVYYQWKFDKPAKMTRIE